MHFDVLNRPIQEGILVLDFGSQYSLLIVRKLRELGVYAEMIDGQALKKPEGFKAFGIILSGGPDSVSDVGSRKFPLWVVNEKVPVLGICYGMQLLADAFSGKVESGGLREYGSAHLQLSAEGKNSLLFAGIKKNDLQVWMSHGDHVASMGDGFSILAETDAGVLAAMSNESERLYGLQFHPEVHHSRCGQALLANFCFKICQTPQNWKTQNLLKSLLEQIKHQVGSGRVLIAVSGGVDSTVAAALIARALRPEQIHAVLVDTGMLRKNEAQWVAEWLGKLGLKHFDVLNRQKVFLDALQGIVDPEEKRKIIGRTFIQEFENFTNAGQGFTHLAQGTLYPDVVESAGHGAGSKVIKSHHNVGGLPERLQLKLLEPFRFLFKDEVRKLGVEIGLPQELVYRHPFPGPGLGIRILGEVSESMLNMLREADYIFIEALRQEGLYDKTWQAFAVLLPVKSVGVMGDNRTYQYTLALRAVNAVDGMTASVSDLGIGFLSKVADKIVRHVEGINRVVFDVTTKPPATIEWE
ncbi:MAG: glutamine-hydrolyzing GMP synthase [Oligoflexales bacterium]|nr:glutamine-hydrolyzing GMP synthase [Oligoflexales bacterium]